MKSGWQAEIDIIDAHIIFPELCPFLLSPCSLMELLRIRHGNEETTVSDHCGIPIDSHYSFPQTFSFLTCQSFLTSPHKAQNYTFSHVHCFRRVKGPCTMIPPSHWQTGISPVTHIQYTPHPAETKAPLFIIKWISGQGQQLWGKIKMIK